MPFSLRSTVAGLLGVLALSVGAAETARADAIPYPNGGSYNSVTYTFTAASTGDLVAYIVGGFSAGYTNELGVLVNGVAQGGLGLGNHSSSLGDSYDFGPVAAGDVLTFVLHNLSLGKDAYSNPALNVSYDDSSDTLGHNHVYSTTYTATSPVFAGVPAGIYVAFEDLPFPGADFNYDDESFVFTNASIVPNVPEPATLSLIGAGLLALGMVRRRRPR